jgi:hypothetical protein
VKLNIGIDLGQARDATALAAVDSYRADAEPSGDARRPRRLKHHDLIHLEKLQPGLSYPAQVAAIVSIVDALAEGGRSPVLWVDATGVGRPVVDLLRRDCPYTLNAVTIGSGSEVVRHGSDISVPKADLIGCLEVVLSTRRLLFAPDLPLAKDLDAELRAFSRELSATGRPLYEGGRGSHDDLVLALALALWAAERGGGGGEAYREMMASQIASRRLDGSRPRV